MNIFCSTENLNQLLEVIYVEMCKVKIWFDRNKQSLNLNKTKMMLFGYGKNNSQVQILIDGVQIERINEITFLGVIIDDQLEIPH